jgi:serine/threonine protein kinase
LNSVVSLILYCLYRLRHPNIVLVMGISLVDIEPAAGRSSTSYSLDQSNVPPPSKSFGWSRHTQAEQKQQKTVCIITEFLEQGSLADILYGPTRLPEEIFTYELVLACALQAARGMLYLHSHQPPICHRDLKSSNLVVDDHWVVKVTDFGMSRIIPEKIQNHEMGLDDTGTTVVSKEDRERDSSNEVYYRESITSEYGMPIPRGLDSAGNSAPNSQHNTTLLRMTDVSDGQQARISHATSQGTTSMAAGVNARYSSFHPEMTSNLGTTAWCAPELLTAASTTRYSVKVDVYSFGMVMWELWEKRRPYDEFHSRFDITDAIRAGKRPVISDNCPPAWKSLVQRCWQAEPARRPTFKYIEKYLKDELARVRRQKYAQGGGGMSFSYGGSSSMSGVRFTSSDGGGLSNRLLMNSTTSDASDLDSTARATNALRERRSSPVPVSNPIHAPEGRTPLVAFERSFSYLAKSLETSSSLSTDSYGQSPGDLPNIGGGGSNRANSNNSNNSNGSAATTRMFGSISGRNVRPTGDQPQSVAAPSQKGWRDRYVLKFSGWQQSNPDAGLPPPVHPATHSASSSSSSAGPEMTSNSNVGSNNKTVAMELRTHTSSNRNSSHDRNSPELEAIPEVARESGTTPGDSMSIRPSVTSNMSVSALEAAIAGGAGPRNSISPVTHSHHHVVAAPVPAIAPIVPQQSHHEMFAMDDDPADTASTAAVTTTPAASTRTATDAGGDDDDDNIVRPSFGVSHLVQRDVL